MNIKKLFNGIIYVSKLTKVSNKKIRIVGSVLLANATVFFDIIVILVFAKLIEKSTNPSPFYVNLIIDNIFLLPLLIVCRYLFVYIERINILSLQLEINESLRNYLMKEVFEKSNYSIADAYFYVNELSENVSYFYGSLSSLLNYGLQVIVYSVYLIYTDLYTVSYFLIGSVLLFSPTKYFLKQGRKFVHQAYTFEHETLENIQRVLENTYLIKILDTTNQELKRFKNIVQKYYSSVLSNYKYGAVNSLTPNFVTIFILSILVAFFNFSNFLSLEFIGILLRLFQTLGNFNNTSNLVINSHVHLEKLYLLEKNQTVNKKEYYFLDSKLSNAIKLENISFKYFNNDTFIFENIELEIEKNKHTIITGTNGSGKSTLLGLMTGVLSPSTGKIYTISNKLSYVGATPLIFKGTLKENILYGNSTILSENKIIKLIEDINLFSSEERVELESIVTNKTLSTGQMQKISFIRAILRNPEILFLDESTSNLDNESKEIINEILKSLNITIINSTHNKEDFLYNSHIKIEMKNNNRILTIY